MLKNQNMDDKVYMEDSLTSQKHATDTYNNGANECEHQNVRMDFMNILKDEHNIQNDIFTQMSQRGWYQTTPAESPKVDAAKQKFQNM